jgi:uncharacterized protein YaaQ
MMLLVIIIQKEDTHKLIDGLTANNIMCTKLSSTGGFLRRGNTTFLVGVEDESVESTLLVIEKSCKTRKSLISTSAGVEALNMTHLLQGVEVDIGGANVFILNIHSMVKL